jgi:two-component system response regulator CpxR
MTTADYQPVKVLALSQAEHDHTCLQHILDHTSWSLWPARNIADAVETIQRYRIPVVVTSEQLPDGNWKDLLSQLQCLPEPPEVILMTTKSDERLWSDVLRSGAYDVIPKPFNNSEVFRIVSLAWRQWRDQWRGSSRFRASYKATA